MSVVKYQHHLARKHMSWFSGNDGKLSIWSFEEGDIKLGVNPSRLGGQRNLYESHELPLNYIEKKILHAIEEDFFSARERIIRDQEARRSDDRRAVRRYAAAQYLRQGYLHKRIVQLSNDMRFLAKEIGLEKIWQLEKFPIDNTRRHASSVMAGQLLDIDHFAKLLSKHVVIFVNRKEADLLLPDSGIMQIYSKNNDVVDQGLASKEIRLLLPIAPNAALKFVRPKKRTHVARREFMSDLGHENFLTNVSVNAKSLVVGHTDVLRRAELSKRPYLDPMGERLSMILQLYRSGTLDELIYMFWKDSCSDIPYGRVRNWFYEQKFRPAINKLFNPDNDPNVIAVPMRF